MLATWAALAVSITWLVLVDSWWWQLPNAVFLALVMGQAALLGHDAGHRQVTRNRWKNATVGFLNSWVAGASWTWWIESHDRHHGRPNQEGKDPAVGFDFIAVTPEQAQSKTGLARFMVRYQALLMLPLMSLYSVSARIDSAKHLLRGRSRWPALEVALIGSHLLLVVGGLLMLHGPWLGLTFLLVNQAAFGLYVASIFLPNHHGMPVLASDDESGFVERQVLTARNIRGGALTDFWFGGLNHQIEHHLFPSAPRANLRAIRTHVKAFCEEKGLQYHEAGWVEAFREVFGHLHRVSKSLKAR
jgi:fatty acid desaturase